MAYTADEVLGMLDSSGESDIEEDPGFLLPYESDSEGEEPHQSISSTSIPNPQTDIKESDFSDEECTAQGIVTD